MVLSRAVGAAGTLLIHAILLVLALWRPDAPPASAVTVTTREQSGDERMRLLPGGDGDGLACEGTYRGVGVQHWASTVIEVVPQGPADRAGMKPGDVWLNADSFSRNEHPLGYELVLRIQRDGQRLDLPVVVGKVCFDMEVKP